MVSKNIARTIGALALSLVIVAGVAGATNVKYASAESSDSATIQELQKTLESLLKQLIEILSQQIKELDKDGIDDSSSDDSDDDSDDDSCDGSSDDVGLSELEATIYTDDTVIKIELDGDKDVVVTTLTDRDDLVELIANEYDLSESEVDDALTIEEEDRASRASDKDWADGDSSDDSCDDSSDDDSDDDDDDDEDDDSDDDDEDDDEDEEDDDEDDEEDDD